MLFESTLFLIIFLILINLRYLIKSESDDIQIKCIFQNSCDNCLLADKLCAWCNDPEYGMVKPRCMLQTEMYKSPCNAKFVSISTDIPDKYTMNKVLKDFDKNDMNVVQIQPQKIELVLQKSIPKQIKFKYKPAKNYPLDLYFLMDLTYTMADDKATLIGMSQFLTTALFNLTENYRLGFGSFIEKPVMPFVMMNKQKNPCSVLHQTCSPTYDFWHQLSLTGNISKFIEQVRLAEISANVDNIESGFDALMQILVCEPEIGWSDISRRIIVYATDGGIHFAGDGKLAGIVQPNDKQCHLDSYGRYTEALNMDYPSVEEIYRVLLDKKTSVIFTVTDIAEYFFLNLYNLMQDVSSIQLLKDDSSNILELIRAGYTKFIKTAKFLDDAPDYISVKYYSTCDGMYPTLTRIDNLLCNNAIEQGREYEIIVMLELLEFPENVSDYNQVIKIEEASLRSEYLELNVTIKKPCKCMEEIGEPKSIICNNHGEFKCGSCFCDEFWAGKLCSCNLQNSSNVRELENLCKEPLHELPTTNDETEIDRSNLVCSDRGECLCGQCICNLGFDGNYCQCPECPKINGEECGGSENAVCNCGQCDCNIGWSGHICDCSTANNLCIPPQYKQQNNNQTSKLCTGHGICECNECVCEQNYFGKFCEMRKGFEENELCEFYNPCVKCMINLKKRKECNNMTDVCQDRNGLQYLAEFFDSLENQKNICFYRTKHEEDDYTCTHMFSYQIDEAQRTQIRIVYDSCVAPNIAMFGGILFLVIILLGILVLTWYKVSTVRKDSREVAQLQQDVSLEDRSNQSPLYVSPIVQYEVPKLLNENQEVVF